MAVNRQEVRAFTLNFENVVDAINKTFFEYFLRFIEEINLCGRVEEKRSEIEATLNVKNYSEKVKEVNFLPVVNCSFSIPKNFNNEEVACMCREMPLHAKGGFVENQYVTNDFKPIYQLDFSNQMLLSLLRKDEKSIDYVKQISFNRIFEKIKERYNGGEIIVNYFTDPISYTKLELQLSQQRDLETPLPGVTQTVYPGNSNYYMNVGSPNSKKDWLNNLNLFMEQSYIPPCGNREEEGFIYHHAFVGSFQSCQVRTEESDSKTEVKKKSRKRKLEEAATEEAKYEIDSKNVLFVLLYIIVLFVCLRNFVFADESQRIEQPPFEEATVAVDFRRI